MMVLSIAGDGWKVYKDDLVVWSAIDSVFLFIDMLLTGYVHEATGSKSIRYN